MPSFSSTTLRGLPWEEVRKVVSLTGAQLEFQPTGMSYRGELAQGIKRLKLYL
jgi:hypothetical protein